MTSIEQSAAAMARYVAELEKEVKALRADALRYRWLRQWYNTPGDPSNGAHDIRAVEGYDYVLTGTELDAAIDAGMGGKEVM